MTIIIWTILSIALHRLQFYSKLLIPEYCVRYVWASALFTCNIFLPWMDEWMQIVVVATISRTDCVHWHTALACHCRIKIARIIVTAANPSVPLKNVKYSPGYVSSGRCRVERVPVSTARCMRYKRIQAVSVSLCVCEPYLSIIQLPICKEIEYASE